MNTLGLNSGISLLRRTQKNIRFLGSGTLVVWIFCLPCLSAQDTDTTLWMDEVSITDQQMIGYEADTIPISDVTARMNSLTDILRTESNVYFRNFGPGSSSTVSMFGSRSNEVALVWNGIKIANPMLGVNDYSLISVADLTSLRIARQGTSSIYGAGSSAGAIILGQEIDNTSHPVTLSAGWSTLNKIKLAGSYSQTKGSWKSRTTVSGFTSQNDYRYTTLDGKENRLPHAHSHSINASHHSEFHLRSNQSLSLSLWARNHFREIPPTLTESRSEADQSDQFIRSLIQYQNLQTRHKLHLKAYYGSQKQIYQNPLIKLNATHIFENAQFRMDNQWQPFNELYVKYGVQNNFFSSRSDNYQGTKNQNRISVYSQIQYDLDRIPLELILLLQPQWVSGQKPGWTTEIKARISQAKMGLWTIYANHNIVWPTLNDLYWNPGGNPALLPEHNRIVGLIWKKNWADHFHHSLSMYHKWAENWIQWLPSDLGYWRPVNAVEGRSQGLNLEVEKIWSSGLEIFGGYQYVRTVILDEISNNNQTIYSPRHMWSVRGHYKLGQRWELQAIGEYTSTRYVTRDHSQSLNPYFLCHSTIVYKLRNMDCTLGLQLKNIFDREYQGIINRPMPGRQIQINTLIKF